MKTWVLLTGMIFALGVQAQVYKWVDKDGNVHFTDQPPPKEETVSEEVDVSASELTPAQERAAVARLQLQQQKMSDQQEGRAKNEHEEKSRRIERHNESVRKSNACTKAQSQLHFLNGGGAIFSTDDNGERHYMDDGTRKATIANMRQQIKQYC